MNRFQWFRKWRGGRWAKLSSGWYQMPQSCVETHDEQWRKVFCGDCAYFDGGKYCRHPREKLVVVSSDTYKCPSFRVSMTPASGKNNFNDCRDFKPWQHLY